jgi:hypothetical protein
MSSSRIRRGVSGILHRHAGEADTGDLRQRSIDRDRSSRRGSRQTQDLAAVIERGSFVPAWVRSMRAGAVPLIMLPTARRDKYVGGRRVPKVTGGEREVSPCSAAPSTPRPVAPRLRTPVGRLRPPPAKRRLFSLAPIQRQQHRRAARNRQPKSATLSGGYQRRQQSDTDFQDLVPGERVVPSVVQVSIFEGYLVELYAYRNGVTSRCTSHGRWSEPASWVSWRLDNVACDLDTLV